MLILLRTLRVIFNTTCRIYNPTLCIYATFDDTTVCHNNETCSCKLSTIYLICQICTLHACPLAVHYLYMKYRLPLLFYFIWSAALFLKSLKTESQRSLEIYEAYCTLEFSHFFIIARSHTPHSHP